jgi:hypothetical protein
MKKSPFKTLEEMSLKNMDIHLAPLSNILDIKIYGAKAEVTIGLPAHIAFRLTKGEKFTGGLLLANSEQFNSLMNND